MMYGKNKKKMEWSQLVIKDRMNKATHTLFFQSKNGKHTEHILKKNCTQTHIYASITLFLLINFFYYYRHWSCVAHFIFFVVRFVIIIIFCLYLSLFLLRSSFPVSLTFHSLFGSVTDHSKYSLYINNFSLEFKLVIIAK